MRHDRLHMRPVIDDVDSIVMQATTRDIDRVNVGGRTVVENGRLPADVEAAHTRLAPPLGGWKLPVPPNMIDGLSGVIHANVTPPTNA
jgi:hypothetical protein